MIPPAVIALRAVFSAAIMDNLDLDLARNFHALTRDKRALEVRLKSVTKQLAIIEDALRQNMLEAGVPSLPLEHDGESMTLYVHRQVWASLPQEDADRESALGALERNGLGYLIQPSVNVQKLSAEVRERLADDSLPPDLLDTLNISERVQVRARSGERSERTGAAAARNLKNLRTTD